ncbi:MAG TPA: TonB-dependent receptor [Thermoanaerobaculia bacterium]|jgi:vitamin B12 transporter|nr:TonB-dependent receptor [Thermoanaerobaculia bacterium]
MRTTLLVVTLFAGLLGGESPVWSQEPNQTAIPTFNDQLLVSASLDAETKDETPASVTVVGAPEIEARQVTTLADAITLVPGLSIVQTGAPGQQSSLFVRGAESDQTLLLWNGIALNDPYFGGANWQFVPTDGAERIEVIRGPFSALYGSGAMGGVVSLITGRHDGGSLHAEGGENGYARGSVAAGTSLGRLRLDGVGVVRRGGTEIVNDDFDADDLTLRGLFEPRENASVGLMVRGDQSETGIPFSGRTATPDQSISWREREVAVPVRAVVGGNWEIEGQLATTRFNNAFRAPSDPFGFTRSDTESEGRRGRLVGSWQSAKDLRLSFGGDVERLEVTSSSTFGTSLDGSRQRTWAAFAEASAPLGRAQVQVGLRRDDNDVYGEQTSLRAGVVVPLGGFRLRASYGDSFRAPSLGELFFPGSGNPTLRPESGKSFEVGVEREIGIVRVSLVGFENRQNDLIDFDLATFTNVNVLRARSRGVEGEVEAHRGIGTVRLTATYLDAENRTTGEPLLRRAKKSATLLASLAPKSWGFTLSGRYVGDREDTDPDTFGRTEIASYTRFDLSTRYSGWSKFEPFARVENLADREYEEALGFPAPGRTWVGGLAVRF